MKLRLCLFRPRSLRPLWVVACLEVAGCTGHASIGDDTDVGRPAPGTLTFSPVPKDRVPASHARAPQGVKMMIAADGYRLTLLPHPDRWTIITPEEPDDASHAVDGNLPPLNVLNHLPEILRSAGDVDIMQRLAAGKTVPVEFAGGQTYCVFEMRRNR